MYAIVEISGKQFKVEKNKFIYTDKVEPKSGKKVEFDNVLLISDKGKIKLGKPTVKGSKVTGEVLSQLKDDKVIVFKKRRRKNSRRKNGHRQLLTVLRVTDVLTKPTRAKAASKKTVKKAVGEQEATTADSENLASED